MDDRNLLERAAKAHGFIDDETSNDEDSHGLRRNGQGIFYLVYKRGWHNWNPLHDDGDALRLLTRLPGRTLYVSEIGATVSWLRSDGSGHGFKCDEYANEHGGCLATATRRAITRAAAAMAGEGE